MRYAKLIIAIVLVQAVIGSYFIAERNASSAAQALCQQVRPGSDFAEAARIAETQGDRRLSNATSINVMFVGLPPFSRHNCEIRGENGKVVATRYIHLD